MALYAGNCIAIACSSAASASGSDRETLLDVLIVAVSLGALSWVFLMQPYAQDANLGLAVKLVSLAYPAMDLAGHLDAPPGVQRLDRPRRRRRSSWRGPACSWPATPRTACWS
jgi:hypothetical protein